MLSSKKYYKGINEQEEEQDLQIKQVYATSKNSYKMRNKKKLQSIRPKRQQLYLSEEEVQQKNQRNFWIVFVLTTIIFIICWSNSSYLAQPYLNNYLKHQIKTSDVKIPNSDKLDQSHAIDPSSNSKKLSSQNTYESKTQNVKNYEKQIQKLQRQIKQKLKPEQGTIKTYKYGDQINFALLNKRNRYIKETLLNQQNLEYAARFFNLLGKDIKNNEELKEIYKMEVQYYDRKYHIKQFKQEIQICVIVYGYENYADNRYKAGLDSIFQQNYQNYHVIYVSDNSPKTGQMVQSYVSNYPKITSKITFINNQVKKGKSKVFYQVGHQYCKPGSIMYPLDGADNLIGRQVFNLLNAIYQGKNAKFVYMNFLQFYKEGGEIMLSAGYSRQTPMYVKTNKLYRQKATPLNLRSWASNLFLSIKEEDYKFDSEFVPIGDDLMIIYTLQEMASDRVEYVPQIVYFYNGDVEISYEEETKKQRIVKHARGRQKVPVNTQNIQWRMVSIDATKKWQ